MWCWCWILRAAWTVRRSCRRKQRLIMLDHLGQDDRFNIVAFSTATRTFNDRPVSLACRGEGHAFIRDLAAAGSTDINRALLEALTGVDAERPTVIIFLTDGLPTAGEVDPDRIVGNVAGEAPKSVRLFAFGVGYDVDTVLLDQLSGGSARDQYLCETRPEYRGRGVRLLRQDQLPRAGRCGGGFRGRASGRSLSLPPA